MVSYLTLFFSSLYLGVHAGEVCNPETGTIKNSSKKNLFVLFCFIWEWECFVCLFFSQMTREGVAGEENFLIVTTVYFSWLYRRRPKFPSSSIDNEIHFLHYWLGSKETKSLSLCFKHWPEGMRFLLHPAPPSCHWKPMTHMGSLDFHPHLAVMRHTSLSPQCM